MRKRNLPVAEGKDGSHLSTLCRRRKSASSSVDEVGSKRSGQVFAGLPTFRRSFQFNDELGIEIHEVGRWMVELTRS